MSAKVASKGVVDGDPERGQKSETSPKEGDQRRSSAASGKSSPKRGSLSRKSSCKKDSKKTDHLKSQLAQAGLFYITNLEVTNGDQKHCKTNEKVGPYLA